MLTKIILSLAGIGLMYYEKVVDENMTAAESARKEYKASCDMKVDLLFTEQEFSCSTILKSDYAVGFGFLQNVNIYKFFCKRYPKIYCFIFKINHREIQTEIFQVLPVDSPFIQPNYVYGLWHYILQLFVAILGDGKFLLKINDMSFSSSISFPNSFCRWNRCLCLFHVRDDKTRSNVPRLHYLPLHQRRLFRPRHSKTRCTRETQASLGSFCVLYTFLYPRNYFLIQSQLIYRE